jgi:hypothetical protein
MPDGVRARRIGSSLLLGVGSALTLIVSSTAQSSATQTSDCKRTWVQPSAERRRFEEASIRRSTATRIEGFDARATGRFTARGVTPLFLID